MISRWNDNKAGQFKHDPLQLRVYTSQLLGQDASLVLHGGGNTSVKDIDKNLFGETEEVLFVKGSGWDLSTIQAAGFAPVRLKSLQRMAGLKELSDSEMVKAQRAAMTDPYAPNPSVEAILHAIIPFKFVDHTHADAVVAITNTPNGEKRIREVYGPQMLIVPYVMPGFVLAQKVYEMTKDMDWSSLQGMILMNHGVFTFHDDAKVSYERMIQIVSKAEEYLHEKGCQVLTDASDNSDIDFFNLARVRQSVSQVAGRPMLAKIESGAKAMRFCNLPNIKSIATRGPLTPDHVLRTKRIPVILGTNPEEDMNCFSKDYGRYFAQYKQGDLTCSDSAPRWAVWPGQGVVSFGRNLKEAKVISGIIDHTMDAIQWAEKLGGWKALGAKEIFAVEYWSLEQAKLKKSGKPPAFQGKVALVTGAASGIGRACVEALQAQGAVVTALDIDEKIKDICSASEILGLCCDVTDSHQIQEAVQATVRHFGGLDIVISNAGTFPASQMLAEMNSSTWEKSLSLNLTSHQSLLKECIPYLELGIEPAVVIIASKNVPAPGPGAAAYSVAKAGLTQLARIAALELGPKGIRVNVLHPNQVFDTAIWTQDVLEKRAAHYGVTVEEYKTSNILRTQMSSDDVAQLACSMAGPTFAKTTGAQIPIDGGNERVI